MSTRSIVLHEVAGFAGFVSAITIVWGNFLFMLAVCAIYVGFRVRYWQASFKKATAEVARKTKAEVWQNITRALPEDQASDELD